MQSPKIDIVRRVNRLSCAKDSMCDWDAASEERRVFYVVDTIVHNVRRQNLVYLKYLDLTYSKDAVCSIPTTLVMIAKLSSGTLSHTLNAAINCFRISFPGWSNM